MQELLIDVKNNRKNILLLENGKLIERYVEEEGQERLEGNIYLGIVENVLQGMQAAFVDIGKDKNTFIHIRDILPKASNETGNKNENFSKYNIKEYLKTGSPILVQVKKDSTNKKGARISSHISMPGRFVVIMPNEEFVTVSQKIDNENERDRLKSIVKKCLPRGFGAIVRTSAVSKSAEEVVADIEKTINTYKNVKSKYDKEIQKAKNAKPQLLYKSEDVVSRLLTDLMDQDLYRILTNDKKVFMQVEEKLKETS